MTTPETPCGTYPVWDEVGDFNAGNPITNYAFFPMIDGQSSMDIWSPTHRAFSGDAATDSGQTVTFTMSFWAADGTTLLGSFSFLQTGVWLSSDVHHFTATIPAGTASITHDAYSDMAGDSGPPNYFRLWFLDMGYTVYCAPVVPPVAIPSRLATIVG